MAAQGIDVHAHGIPRTLLTEIDRRGDRYGGMAVEQGASGPVVILPGAKRLRPLAAKMLDFDSRIAWLDERGLSHQVVSPWLDMQGHELDTPAGAAWAEVLNDTLAEACANSSGRLIPLATIPFGDAAASVREMERCAKDLGLTGAMVSTNPGSTNLWDEALDELWTAAEDLGQVIVLHPPVLGATSALPDGAEFGNLWHRLVDTTLVATRLILNGVLDRHPKLRLVLVHGGGFLPYQAGRLDRSYAIGTHPQSAIGDKAPSDYIGRFHYDTCVMQPPAIRLLADVAGLDKVVLGSDYPFPIGDQDPVGSVRSCRFNDPEIEQVLRGNAARLLSL